MINTTDTGTQLDVVTTLFALPLKSPQRGSFIFIRQVAAPLCRAANIASSVKVMRTRLCKFALQKFCHESCSNWCRLVEKFDGGQNYGRTMLDRVEKTPNFGQLLALKILRDGNNGNLVLKDQNHA